MINTLQLIIATANARLGRTSNEETAGLCRSVIAQALAVARVYRRLSIEHGNIEMAECLAGLCQDFRQIVPEKPHISLETDLDPLSMPREQAIFLALISTELIINAVKHAFVAKDRGRIAVQLRQTGGSQSALTVADDGIGMPAKSRRGASCLRLVRDLVSGLDGTLRLSSGLGTRVEVVFPHAVPTLRANSI